MPAHRLISLNNNAGAFVDILASIPSTRVMAMEDESVAVQGMQAKTLIDAFATVRVLSFGSEPLWIPDPTFGSASGREGKLIGMPAQGVSGAFNFRAADKIISARSNGAAGTTLAFDEYE